ncbi:unnamed protein product [Adineta steineri]|uniref:VTT domain-containing protein n=1 Tax=Adineta steineri TaxID=433720 RepID=A0A814TS88_9BILA|nr:unnamed protein product [Adineta steineri]
MRQQRDSELEMELIPRQTSNGIDSSSLVSSSSTISSSSSSTKSSFNLMNSSLTVWFIPLLFALATIYMYILSTNAPPLSTDQDRASLHFPRSIDSLKNLSATLQHYRDDHLAYLLLLYCSAYLYKQAFSLPGSAILNLLGGALFGTWFGFPLCCLLTATGALLCYLLVANFARNLVVQCCYKKIVLLQKKNLLGGALFGTWFGFPLCCLLTATGALLCYLLVANFARNLVVQCCYKKIVLLQKKVEAGRDNLFFVLLFMRMVPMSPNALITMTCPILNVPKKIFYFSILFGMAPYNFITVQTGSFLSQLNSFDDLFTWRTLLTLGLIASVAGCTGLIVARVRRKIPQTVI